MRRSFSFTDGSVSIVATLVLCSVCDHDVEHATAQESMFSTLNANSPQSVALHLLLHNRV
jgi:hypothetical protein